jgi:hypothetical protein
LHNTPIENIVLLTTIPGYSNHCDVEVSKESWDVLRASVSSVTIAFRHGMFLVAYDDVTIIDRGISLEREALENQT